MSDYCNVKHNLVTFKVLGGYLDAATKGGIFDFNLIDNDTAGYKERISSRSVIVKNKKILILAILMSLYELSSSVKTAYIEHVIERCIYLERNYYHEMNELPLYAVYYQDSFLHINK